MIILDMNPVMLANILVDAGKLNPNDIDVPMFRHMALNSIRAYNLQFRDMYGQMVIAADHQSWRKQYFPYYKGNRQKDKDKSDIDWNHIFDVMSIVRDEIKENFHYPVIYVDGAEADDIIGALTVKYSDTQRIRIISRDKDFRQLQVNDNVSQYDPISKKEIYEPDAARFLKEHIMRGDSGDGIPNFLSPDNSLVMGIRQKSLTTKKLDMWVDQDPKLFCNEEMLRAYNRNELMIDLSKMPDAIRQAIYKEYDAQQGKDKSKIFNYLIENRLRMLQGAINDF